MLNVIAPCRSELRENENEIEIDELRESENGRGKLNLKG